MSPVRKNDKIIRKPETNIGSKKAREVYYFKKGVRNAL